VFHTWAMAGRVGAELLPSRRLEPASGSCQARPPGWLDWPLTLAQPFAGIAGNRAVLDHLSAQLAAGRLPHAHLFVGEPSLGKTTAARALAQALLPEAELRRHPDYWEDDRAESLSIHEIRLLPDKQPEFHEQSLQAFLSRTPAVSPRRVAVISNVGRLADQVQGILLKTLEEPHPGRFLILTTPSISPFVVLPTVVSRCQKSAFQPVAAAEIQALLEARGVARERAAILAGLARGRPGWALRAAEDVDVISRHEAAVGAFEAVLRGGREPALRLAAELDSREAAKEAVASWQLRLRERMVQDVADRRWAELLEGSFDTLGHLEQNVSPRLALEVFLLECART
jgi:DNA polymerase-3 subunit delta'